MAPEPDADIAYDAAGGSGDRPATPLSRTGSLSRRIGKSWPKEELAFRKPLILLHHLALRCIGNNVI